MENIMCSDTPSVEGNDDQRGRETGVEGNLESMTQNLSMKTRDYKRRESGNVCRRKWKRRYKALNICMYIGIHL